MELSLKLETCREVTSTLSNILKVNELILN